MAGYSTPAWANNTSPAINASNLLAMGRAIELAQHPYAVCSTAAATASKSVALDYSDTLSLFTGLTVRVKFTNGNTAANPTLNVSSTGAVPIMSYGTTRMSGILAGEILTLTYDGTNWVVSGATSSSGVTVLLADEVTYTNTTTSEATMQFSLSEPIENFMIVYVAICSTSAIATSSATGNNNTKFKVIDSNSVQQNFGWIESATTGYNSSQATEFLTVAITHNDAGGYVTVSTCNGISSPATNPIRLRTYTGNSKLTGSTMALPVAHKEDASDPDITYTVSVYGIRK